MGKVRGRTHTHLCILLSPCVYGHTLLHVVINVHTCTNTLHTYTHTLTSHQAQNLFLTDACSQCLFAIFQYFIVQSTYFQSTSHFLGQFPWGHTHTLITSFVLCVSFLYNFRPLLTRALCSAAIFQFTSEQLHVKTKLLTCMPSLKAFLWNPKVFTFNASWTRKSRLV